MISVIIPNAQEDRIHEVIDGVEAVIQDCEIIIAVDRDRRGKGWAVREAFKRSKGDIIMFLDGDMDIHPKMIRRLLPHMNEFDIVVGKKDLSGHWSRRIITILSRMFIWTLFRISVDTQTGVKIFEREAISEWKTDGFAFDIEILAKAKRAGARMYEVTIDAQISRKMKVVSLWRTLIATIKIWKEVNHNG
jgi:glycosyltransferase involved in cell wall biosynthesis